MTRRFGPLIFLVLCAYGVIVARLAQVQLAEHEIWASEARDLSRGSTFVPHERGRILDRKGREFVRDEQVYELEFVWRDFRRGHPLGQLCAARSLLELRPVALVEAWDELEAWALALTSLTPEQVDDFGRGAALLIGDPEAALFQLEAADAKAEQRFYRSGHLHFYLKALLQVDRSEARRIADQKDQAGWERPYRELVAGLRGQSQRDFDASFLERISGTRAELARLAEMLGEALSSESGRPTRATERLVARLEEARRRVEGAAADDLFRKAAGFGAWRLACSNLECIELDWLRRSLFWDDERLREWIDSRGQLWRDAVGDYLSSHTVARAKVCEGDPAESVMDALADSFARPRDPDQLQGRLAPIWRRRDELVVCSELDRFVGAEAVADERSQPVLPFQEPALRELSYERGEQLLARALDLDPRDERIEALLKVAGSATLAPQVEDVEAIGAVLLDWDERLQLRLAELLRGIRGEQASVHFVEEWVASALEERAYVVRDRGSRPLTLARDPIDELVLLVARLPEHYAGFRVRQSSERVPLAFDYEADPLPLARELIGKVRSPYIATLLRQEKKLRELASIGSKPDQVPEDGERIRELVAELRLADEFEGGFGVEEMLDPELRGKNGFRETWGLQDVREQGREPLNVAPQPGLDVSLTLDMDLQRAAQRVLAHPPELPASEHSFDPVWWANPVGAIVLMRPNGDLLAAASCPTEAHEPGPHQDGESLDVRERCFQQPRFTPPGSIFKPLVAAWALQFEGLDPRTTVACQRHGAEHPSYGVMHCWNSGGHGAAVDLSAALQGSCNCYFAWLGESLPGEDLRQMATTFGIGQPTGVREFAGELRGGLRENFESRGALMNVTARLQDVERQRIGNGLAEVTATPVQMARAYAGLLTNALPRVRLVSEVRGAHGRQLVPESSVPLPFEPAVLERIHQALRDVVAKGTARKPELSRPQLGFEIAAKTGSADYHPGPIPENPSAPLGQLKFQPGMRKHTWVAGWFPVEDPRLVFVVYLHDTSVTSSHGAVYMAGALLRTPELRSWLEEDQGYALDFGPRGEASR